MGYFSFEDNRCGLCGTTFDKDGALEQHIEAIHGHLWLKVTGMVTAILIAGGVFYYFYYVRPNMTIDPNDYDGAQQGEHWHADYSIEVCGEKQQPFYRSEGDVHTHGNGQIHIHPHSSATAGPAANLEAFVDSINGEMTDTNLIIPGWGIDSTEGCDGEPSEFVVFVNGYRVENPTNYTPQDGDSVRFVIRPRSGQS